MPLKGTFQVPAVGILAPLLASPLGGGEGGEGGGGGGGGGAPPPGEEGAWQAGPYKLGQPGLLAQEWWFGKELRQFDQYTIGLNPPFPTTTNCTD